MLPSAAQGAICAMQDAVILTNCLYDMAAGPLRQESIELALHDYREQRYKQVQIQVDNSNMNATLLIGQVRNSIKRCLPCLKMPTPTTL